jgi:hypothetical protein
VDGLGIGSLCFFIHKVYRLSVLVINRTVCVCRIGIASTMVLVTFFSHLSLAGQPVLINQPLSDVDPRYEYIYELLSLVLETTEAEHGALELQQASMVISRDRTLASLIAGNSIHVMAEAPKPHWGENLLSVEIPLRKGMQGFRVFILHSRNESKLRSVNSFDELINLPTGSGTQWSTRQAMEMAGFDVVTSPSYKGLFGMLSANRFTTFSRGINEAYREVEAHKHDYPNLIVDDKFLLQIPLPTYFYVTPKRPKLAQRIRRGLLQLTASGEFDRFFYRYHCDDLVRSHMSERRLFKVNNPLLEKPESLEDTARWIDPKTDYASLCRTMNL